MHYNGMKITPIAQKLLTIECHGITLQHQYMAKLHEHTALSCQHIVTGNSSQSLEQMIYQHDIVP